MNENRWIKDFPQINQHYHYFDSAATSLKPLQVIDAMNDYYLRLSANINRGMYLQSQEATEKYEEARKTVSTLINANENEIIFTRGTTASLNLVATAYGLNHLKKNDVVLTTKAEHHSSILPWIHVAKQRDALIQYIELDDFGKIDLEAYRQSFHHDIKVVVIHHVSNVLGYVSPLKEMIDIAHQNQAIVVVDGAQAIQHMKVDVKDLDADFYAFSGHKMLGPTGIGVLYGKHHWLEKLDPIEFGGDMSLDVSDNDFSWKEPPVKFEAGTMPIGEAIGLKAAIDYINQIGIEAIHQYSKELYDYFYHQLESMDGVEIYNPHSDTFIFTFNLKNVPSHDAISYFAESNIALRAGQHCAALIHQHLNIVSSLRGTIYFYNTKRDVDVLIQEIKKAIDYFKQLGF